MENATGRSSLAIQSDSRPGCMTMQEFEDKSSRRMTIFLVGSSILVAPPFFEL
jgi:hypothetical protein